MDISSHKEPLSKSNKLVLFLYAVSWFILSFVVLFALYFGVISLLYSFDFALGHLTRYPGEWTVCLASPALLIALSAERTFKRQMDQDYTHLE